MAVQRFGEVCFITFDASINSSVFKWPIVHLRNGIKTNNNNNNYIYICIYLITLARLRWSHSCRSKYSLINVTCILHATFLCVYILEHLCWVSARLPNFPRFWKWILTCAFYYSQMHNIQIHKHNTEHKLIYILYIRDFLIQSIAMHINFQLNFIWLFDGISFGNHANWLWWLTTEISTNHNIESIVRAVYKSTFSICYHNEP